MCLSSHQSLLFGNIGIWKLKSIFLGLRMLNQFYWKNWGFLFEIVPTGGHWEQQGSICFLLQCGSTLIKVSREMGVLRGPVYPHWCSWDPSGYCHLQWHLKFSAFSIMWPASLTESLYVHSLKKLLKMQNFASYLLFLLPDAVLENNCCIKSIQKTWE